MSYFKHVFNASRSLPTPSRVAGQLAADRRCRHHGCRPVEVAAVRRHFAAHSSLGSILGSRRNMSFAVVVRNKEVRARRIGCCSRVARWCCYCSRQVELPSQCRRMVVGPRDGDGER
jgi:hypothetical protein